MAIWIGLVLLFFLFSFFLGMKNSLKVTPFSGKGMVSHKFLFLEKKIAKNCDEKPLFPMSQPL